MIIPIIIANTNKEKDDKNDDCTFSVAIAYPSWVSALNKDGIFKDVDRIAFLHKKYFGSSKYFLREIIHHAFKIYKDSQKQELHADAASDEDGTIETYIQCLKVELVLKR